MARKARKKRRKVLKGRMMVFRIGWYVKDLEKLSRGRFYEESRRSLELYNKSD